MDEEHGTGRPTGAEPAPRATPAETPTRTPRKSRLGLKLVGIFIVLPVLVFAAWIAITLSWVYSRGERAGYVQKFSQKGWICKTWEGELAMVNMPGTAPTLFPFTVKSDSVAQVLTSLMGSRVAVTYEQHRGVPGSCFGETEYYVTAAKAVAGP
jgi:hypothetical protein